GGEDGPRGDPGQPLLHPVDHDGEHRPPQLVVARRVQVEPGELDVEALHPLTLVELPGPDPVADPHGHGPVDAGEESPGVVGGQGPLQEAVHRGDGVVDGVHGWEVWRGRAGSGEADVGLVTAARFPASAPGVTTATGGEWG